MKRLFLDIETAPNEGLFWRAGYKIDIPYDNITKERQIICACWKWHGQKKLYSAHWGRKKQNDKKLLESLIPFMNEADEIVGHFVDGFDVPWIKTRCLFHRIKTLPRYKTLDTKAWASKHFYFNSNKLDYILKFLGLKGKLKTEFDLWKRVLRGEKKALKYMIKYCGYDILGLEEAFNIIEPYVPHKTHVGVLHGLEKWSCPRDGSEHVKISKTRVTATGVKQFQFQCQDCGGYYSVGEPAKNKYLKHMSGLRA